MYFHEHQRASTEISVEAASMEASVEAWTGPVSAEVVEPAVETYMDATSME